MNIYLYVIAPLVIMCATGIAVTIRIRRRRIICPNCSSKTKFAKKDRVGLCTSCAATHEFVPFRFPNGTQIGIVGLKKHPDRDAPRVMNC